MANATTIAGFLGGLIFFCIPMMYYLWRVDKEELHPVSREEDGK